jgi:pimeloyl-ACP methyl ester carboxylesterase
MSLGRLSRRLSLAVGAGIVYNWMGNCSEKRKLWGIELKRFSQWFLLHSAMIDFFWTSDNFSALSSLLRANPGKIRVLWDILGRAKSESEIAMIDFNGDSLQHKIIFRLSQRVAVHPDEVLMFAQSPSPLWPHLVSLVDRQLLTTENSAKIVAELLNRRSEKIIDFLEAAEDVVMSPSEVEICWKNFPHRRKQLMTLHLERGGAVHGNFLLYFISDPAIPVPGYLCADTSSFLPAVVERAEISLGLTDTRMRAYAEHLAQTLEEEDASSFAKFPIIITHEEFLRRVEIITDSLAPEHPLSEIFRLLKPQFAASPKIAANIAALGPFRTRRDVVRPVEYATNNGSTEAKRLQWNESLTRFPVAPRLLEGLNPVYWPKKLPNAVVVLIHGLRGDERTWRFADEPGNPPSSDLWPGVLIPSNFPEMAVFAFSFDAPLWSVEHQERYTEISVPRRIEAISDRLKACLVSAGLDKFPCIFVCHSMGGLVVKHLLVNDRSLRESSKGIVFFSTPHLGSSIADFAITKLLTPPFVAELSRKDKNLLALNDRFVALKLQTLSFFETAPTDIGRGIKTLVVSRASAEGAGGTCLSAGDRVDHVQSCKLARVPSGDDKRLSALVDFFSAVIGN